jgi:hypothetical protein
MNTKLNIFSFIILIIIYTCSLKTDNLTVDDKSNNAKYQEIKVIKALKETLLKKYNLEKGNTNNKIILGFFEYKNFYIAVNSSNKEFTFDIKKDNDYISKNLSLTDLKSKFPNIFLFFNSAIAGNKRIILDASKCIPEHHYLKTNK